MKLPKRTLGPSFFLTNWFLFVKLRPELFDLRRDSMGKLVSALIFLVLSSSVFAGTEQKMPLGAMKGDFRVSEECVSYVRGCPDPKISVQVKVVATTELVRHLGARTLNYILGDSFKFFFLQNGVSFLHGGSIEQIVQADGEGSLETARRISREKNTLLVFLTHVPPVIKDPKGNTHRIASFSGGKFIVVWIDPGLRMSFHPRYAILHELGHEFGAAHENDTESAMCTEYYGLHCNRDAIYFGGKSLAEISEGVKEIKEKGFEDYVIPPKEDDVLVPVSPVKEEKQ